MESTFDAFVAETAALFGKDFDHAFKKMIESSAIGYRASLLKQEFDKNGRFPTASLDPFCMSLIKVPAIECCLNDNVECDVSRTKFRVPAPIRTNRFADPFLFVGTGNREVAFTFVQFENIQNVLEGTKFISQSLMYAYDGTYIFTFNYEGNKIAIRSVVANRYELRDTVGCNGKPCAEEVYLEEDMKKTIRQMIIEDFRGVGILPKEREININESQP